MKPWQAVVIGVDFSESSIAALREAARLAHWQQCPLHVAHVISANKDYQHPSESSTAISLVRDKVEEKLKALCLDEIDYIGNIEYHIIVGHPFRELCQLSEDINPNLLVLGSRGTSSKTHRAGIIATKCVRKAPVPVLLVRKSHENPYRNVLAALDFSETSLKAAEIAAEIAFENQSRLHLVHVYEPLLRSIDYAFFNFTTCVEITDLERQKLRAKLKECQLRIQSEFKDLGISTHLIETGRIADTIADTIASFIDSNHVGLAALGTRGRTGLSSLLLGTTAERLIHECPCSVLAVKPDDFHFPL